MTDAFVIYQFSGPVQRVICLQKLIPLPKIINRWDKVNLPGRNKFILAKFFVKFPFINDDLLIRFKLRNRPMVLGRIEEGGQDVPSNWVQVTTVHHLLFKPALFNSFFP